ncbi:MAG: hypothetical protein ABH851_06730 [Methanobacteriota archaeon]
MTDESKDPINSLKKAEEEVRILVEQAERDRAEKIRLAHEKAGKIISSARARAIKIRAKADDESRKGALNKTKEILSHAKTEALKFKREKAGPKVIINQAEKFIREYDA